MLGLAESGHWDKVADALVANFGYEIDAQGRGYSNSRTYYLSRSQPPFFAFIWLSYWRNMKVTMR